MVKTIPMSGGLADRPFHELLTWASSRSYTGVLVLVCGEIKKSIVFEQGKIVLARSNLPNETLSSLLVEEGKVGSADLERSIEMISGKESVHQGEVLLSMGLLDSTSLHASLQKQLKIRICEVFKWSDGKYAFVSQIPERMARVPSEQSVSELCFMGLREKYEAKQELLSEMHSSVPVMSDGVATSLESLKLLGRELALIRAINGVSSLKSLAHKSRMEERLVISTVLALRDLGYVSFKEVQTSQQGLAKPTGPQLSDSKQGLTKDMRLFMKGVFHKTYFEILGLERGATTKEIKESYFSLARKCHPDRLGENLNPEDRKLVQDAFAKISEAQAVLGATESRREYEASLDLEDAGVAAETATQILESEMLYQKGVAQIRKGDLLGAIDSLKRAIEFFDQEPEYFVMLGWALFKQGMKMKRRQDMEKGKALLEEAITKQRVSDKAFYYLGMIAKSDGHLAQAKEYFEKTLELAPRHPEALSEVRLLNARQTKEEKSGLLGLFGKKK